MPIEALYPYIAVAYGTFGLVFGVALWWKTQRRIDRTRTAIETQVAAAVVDIGNKVDAKLEGFEDVDIDLAPVMAKLEAIETGIPDLIGTHVAMAIKGVQATEAKQIGKFIDEMGLEAATDEAKQMIVERMTGRQRFGVKLMTAKIPKGVKETNPTLSWLFDNVKVAAGQYLVELDENGGGPVQRSTESSGFGVR